MTKRGFYAQLEGATERHGTSRNLLGEEAWRQCFFCTSYKELRDPEGADYGVCLNAGSMAFGKVVFEHFGCSEHRYCKDA